MLISIFPTYTKTRRIDIKNDQLRNIRYFYRMVGKDYILERDGYPVWWNDVVKD